MQQAIHIFKKDVRHLRREIGLVVALAAIFAGNALEWMEILLPIAAGILIVRLIHAEAIPGDNQFWITRPYRWKSLLGAKLLFILVFVNLPVCVALGLILIGQKFPVASILPGLLWSQVMLILGVWLPIAALAAVTAGITPVILSTLILLTIGFSAYRMMIPLDSQWPIGVEWVRDSIAVSALVAIALSILYMQYKNRRTTFSRTFALGAIVLGAAAYWCAPWSLALAVQSRLSKQPFDGASLQITIDSNSKRLIELPGHRDKVWINLAIAVKGAPDEVDVRADALTVKFQWPDGRTWNQALVDMNRHSNAPGVIIFDRIASMDSSFFNQEGHQPATVRASLYLTIFGNARAQTILVRDTPVNVMDGLQCYTGVFDEFFCRSAFRWPARLVYAKIRSDMTPLAQLISYSPFPAGIGLNFIENRGTSGPPPSAPEVTIVVKEPLAHFRRDFEARGVHLAGLAAP